MDSLRFEVRYWQSNAGARPVRQWLQELSASERKRLGSLITMPQYAGHGLGLPHRRYLGGDLFELREMSSGFRIYYTFIGKKIIVLLAGGNKGSQERDIEKARKRLERKEE